MKMSLLNIRLDLFNGAAGAGAGSGGGNAGADGASGAANSGVSNGENKAGVTPTPRSRRNAGVYDNIKFGKQPTAEGAGADDAVVASDAGKDGNGAAESTENTGAEAEKKADAPKSREERRRAYDEFIKGEGREFYAEDTQRIVSKRVGDLKAMEAKMSKLQPFMDALGDKYNLSSDDLEGLMKAIQSDRDFFSEAAAEAGMEDAETYRQFREAKRKADAFEAEQHRIKQARANAERQSFVDAKIRDWQAQADAVKQKYPDFDFIAEQGDRQFMKMLRAGIDVETAYRAKYHDKILEGRVAAAKSETEKNVVENIRAKGSRPQENGMSSASSFTYKSDVSKLTKADRAEIARRVARGEKIEF